MSFIKPVTKCYASQVKTGVLASDKVKTNKLRGRHAVSITAVTECKIGGEEVLESKTVGMTLSKGQNIIIPVDSTRCDQLYVNGTCDIVEFF